MTQPVVAESAFSDLARRLVQAHQGASEDPYAYLAGFSFEPGGQTYRLRPPTLDPEQALLEIDVIALDDVLTEDDATLQTHRLRAMLQLNETLLCLHNWLISLDEDDVLTLSTPIALQRQTVEAVQWRALDGLQRAQALRQLWDGLSPLPPAPAPASGPSPVIWPGQFA